MKKAIVGLLGVTMLLAGCSSSEVTSDETADGNAIRTLTIGASPASPSAVPIWVALEEGFFQERGYDAELVEFGGTPALATAVMSGTADVASLGLGGLWPQLYQGADFTSLMANLKMPYRIVVHNDVSTPNLDQPYPAPLEDLKGLTVSVPALVGSAYDLLTNSLIAAGLDPENDVDIVAIEDPNTLASAFLSGQMDAIVFVEPVFSRIGAENFKEVLDGSTLSQYENYMLDAWTAKSQWVVDNPEDAQAFCEVVHMAHEFIVDPANEAAVKTAILGHLQLTDEQATSFARASANVVGNKLSRDKWEAQTQFMSGDMKEFTPEYNNHVYEPCVEIQNR